VTTVQAQDALSQQTPGQGVAQVPLQVKTLGVVQFAGALTVHAPLTASQHLPMQGVGVQVPPQKKILGVAHVAGVAPVVQEQSVLAQQTPVHGLGVQTLAGPLYVVPPGQPVTVTAAHAQVMLSQQTPGHGVAQVPLQVKTLGVTHEAGALTVHAPETASQHLPMQGVGVQVPPQKKMLGVAQVAGVAPVVQEQSVLAQQTPVHGLGVQTLAGPL
jgi:hypothetical protein